jgi:farnesyl-diphosphate farnesyltransferase
MQNAALLPDGLRNKRLAMESAIIIAIANTLSRKLRSADPLSQRVKLNKVKYAYCCLAGMWRGLF